MPTDIEQLVVNLRENNGELVQAIAMLTGLLQKVADKLGDQDLKNNVDVVKGHIKTIALPKRDPPGCRLTQFDALPLAVQELLGQGWKGFFDQ